jgi:hypothetical protein
LNPPKFFSVYGPVWSYAKRARKDVKHYATSVRIEKLIIFLKNLARRTVERVFKAQILTSCEHECESGCVAYESSGQTTSACFASLFLMLYPSKLLAVEPVSC